MQLSRAWMNCPANLDHSNFDYCLANMKVMGFFLFILSLDFIDALTLKSKDRNQNLSKYDNLVYCNIYLKVVLLSTVLQVRSLTFDHLADFQMIQMLRKKKARVCVMQ